MKNKHLTVISLLAISLIFSACGGGDSSLDNTNTIDIKESTEGNSSTTDENIAENNTIIENPTTNTPELITNIALAKQEPYFQYAWHIESKNNVLNNSNYSINGNADINVTEAWKITMGEGVKVAVIDDGAEVEHEDLKENLYIAYNADEQTSNIAVTGDGASHGNHCAGFIVSPINSKGSVGIAPKAKLIAIRQDELNDAKTIAAFEYARQQGAKVISCSWGTNNVSDAIVAELKSLYDDGITILFASGNDGASLDVDGTNDESEVEWVIGVGASTEANDVSTYSNYGQHLEVIAPGGDIVESSGLLGLDDMGEKGSNEQRDLVSNNYAFIDGTSFATPIAAGVVTLMYAVNPNITPAEVKKILITTSTKVGINSDASYDNDGFDKKRAYGKINAGLAVLEAKKLLQN